MAGLATQYIVRIDRGDDWELRLHELGLNREAYSLKHDDAAPSLLIFWERDRDEALRILSALEPDPDLMRSSHRSA